MRTPHDSEAGIDDARDLSLSVRSSGLARRGGLAFFWVLNDDCKPDSLLQQLNAFQKAGVEGLILHPRNGLLVPYGGKDWFSLIQWLVQECLLRGIEPILYDEDPYPSGSAGGRIVAEHPECLAYGIERFIAAETLGKNELFLFPPGRLCWAGIVFPNDPERSPIDLTDRVGMIRCHWEKAEWNSRWYYPCTPVYPHPRAFAHNPQFGLLCPEIPSGGELVAFVARPVQAANEWGTLVDALDPRATRLFLKYTHERYKEALGQELGRGIRCIFTDEPKPQALYSWTPRLFADFDKEYGYDLRPHLNHLFEQSSHPAGMKVRLDYRQWITDRFNQAWVEPVARWCRKNKVGLIGHLSPEEDPVNQAATLGNLFPSQRSLLLGGYDLIVAAIGDAQHTLLNIGPLIATSASQQNAKPGVCCESLGAFGVDISIDVVAKTLAWQAMHGATLAVVHGAFSSQMGLRRYEAPPDYGTNSPNWPAIQEVCRDIVPFLKSTVGATQEAPVAILWPIRSFQALGEVWQDEDTGLRHDLLALIRCCLENQIGIHFIDEADLKHAKVRKAKVCLGRAAYQWILVPSLLVMEETTRKVLEDFQQQGVFLAGVGQQPSFERKEKQSLSPAKVAWQTYSNEEFESAVLPRLPGLLDLPASSRKSLHLTSWRKGRAHHKLLMHVGSEKCILTISGKEYTLVSGDLLWLCRRGKQWVLAEHFSPRTYTNVSSKKTLATFQEWEMLVPGQPPVSADYPLGAWQLVPTSGPHQVRMIVTSAAHIGGGKIAETISYRTEALLPDHFKKAVLYIEPTLMRGRFTLKIGSRSWQFSVSDTDSEIQKIDLSEAGRAGESLPMCFTLHEPEALDGIKHSPYLEVY